MSVYLEVFILIGVAIGGSAVVYGAASRYVGALSGPSVTVAAASIRQGSYSAVESVTVDGSADGQAGTLVISTSGAPTAASYCYSVMDPYTGAVSTSTCPSMSSDPATVSIPVPAQGWTGVLVQLIVTGGGFALGSGHLVTVTASEGAQATAEVQVVPA
ncbi:MAG: hypothetical protein JRM73_04830 [Nitrososphaerota archaeon]|nr:hypothetical protein [Nitrososphaerota archaeon]